MTVTPRRYPIITPTELHKWFHGRNEFCILGDWAEWSTYNHGERIPMIRVDIMTRDETCYTMRTSSQMLVQTLIAIRDEGKWDGKWYTIVEKFVDKLSRTMVRFYDMVPADEPLNKS